MDNNMNRDQSMVATLADLLNVNNGIYNRFTWFYCGNNWLSDIKKLGDQVQIEIVDSKDIRKTITLDAKTKVRNYED
jgi:hypothetical protein